MKKHLALFTVLISLLVSSGVWAQTIVLDGVPIGITNPKEGHFTNLEATTQITLGAETITNFSGLDDDRVKASSGDTTPGFLDSKIVAGAGVTVTPGANTITISAPPVNLEDSDDGVEVTFAGLGEYDPGTGVVSALDLNGTGLVVNQTDPTVTVGGISSTVLASSDNPQQVIVRVPQGLSAGNYKLKVKNANGFSEGLIPLNQTFFDGSAWTEATSAAAWSGRHAHTSIVFNNKMWVLGGYDGTRNNDVWSSTDGVTWALATADASWSDRAYTAALVFDNKMWVLGGGGTSADKNDVYYTTDGITWTQATANAQWSARFGHSALVFDNKMWVIGGYDGGRRNDVWYSSDGITWTEATAGAPWTARLSHRSSIYDNKMWVIGGGIAGAGASINDAWYSTDGITWTEATADAPWTARQSHTLVVYNNKMWVLGGTGNSIVKNDVWSSSDGITWFEATAGAAWASRYLYTSVVYSNKIWVIGGLAPSNVNDVWHTSN